MNNTSIPKNDPQKSHSFLVSCLIGLLIFLVLFGLLEAGYRTNILKGFLPVRSVGSYHSQFEQKLFKLDDYVRTYGGVDVIVLGNSMVNTGIIPGNIANAYNDLTGSKPRIFNFGVEGLTISPISDIAKILVQRYHPGTIILFTEMRDYIANNGDQVEENFLANAWIQLQLGNWSLKGAAVDQSLALQHLISLRNWSRYDFLDSYNTAYNRSDAMTQTGYEEEARRPSILKIIREPDPNNPNDAADYALFKNYKMDIARISDLQKVLFLHTQGTEVLVGEMPIYPTYYEYLESDAVRTRYLTDISKFVESFAGTFIPNMNPMLIPLNGRADDHHLNYIGAPVYSDYLGKQLGNLCLQDSVCLKTSSADIVQ